MFDELNKKSTFKELKNWFEENMDMLPTTLDSKCIYYNDVKFTAKLYISNVLSEGERLGVNNIKRSAVATSSKGNLYRLYVDLQIVDNWEADRPRFKIK